MIFVLYGKLFTLFCKTRPWKNYFLFSVQQVSSYFILISYVLRNFVVAQTHFFDPRLIPNANCSLFHKTSLLD